MFALQAGRSAPQRWRYLALLLILAAATTAHVSTLSKAGDWASIAAAVFAFLLLVAGIFGWARRVLTASAIDHGLHMVGPACHFEPTTPPDGTLTIGFDVKNGCEQPIRFQTDQFLVRLGGEAFPDTALKDVDKTAPAQIKGWRREPVPISLADRPIRLEVRYRVLYGPRKGRMRRVLAGAYETTIPAAGTETIWRELDGPERDERLPRRLKAGLRARRPARRS